MAAAARLSVGLPYRCSRMRVERRPDTVHYRASRIVPPGARSDVELRSGRRLAPSHVGGLEDYLTARFYLYSSSPIGLARVDVEHAPWVLHHGSAVLVDDRLVAAAGISVGAGQAVRVGDGYRGGALKLAAA